MFRVSYLSTYFIQGLLLGLLLSYYAFVMETSAFVMIATIFLLMWTIKPLYAIIIDKFNKLPPILAGAFSTLFLVLPETELPMWLAMLGGFGMGLIDITVDGWLTGLSREKKVDPDYWAGLGFASRSTGFLSVVLLTIIYNYNPSLVILFVRAIGLTAAVIDAIALTKFRYSEMGDLRVVWRHFKKNSILYLAVYISTSWGSSVFDVATKLFEARSLLIEIIFITVIFSFVARKFGREFYIYRFVPAISVVSTAFATYGFFMNIGLLVELGIAITASLPWPVYGIINDKAGEIDIYPVFYTSLLYGLSNLFDVIYLHTLTFLIPLYLLPIFYLIFEVPLMVVLRRES